MSEQPLNGLGGVILFKNHGKTIGDWQITAWANESRAELVIAHTKVVGGAAVKSVVPVAGKNIGRANETTPAQQALLEMNSRVNKQLDKGYVRTFVEAESPATNALGLKKPMLAHPLNKVKPENIDWEHAYAQPKLDGHRCLTQGIMYSRQGKEIHMPHIREALGDYGLLGKGLDGELYVHGMLLQDIGSLIKRPREESRQLQYHIYDLMRAAPYSERKQELGELILRAEADGAPLCLVPTYEVANREELDTLHKRWLTSGYEGSILRHGGAHYEDDTRSTSLIKVKDFEDHEFKVVGFRFGTPRTLLDGRVLRLPIWVCRNPFAKTDEVKTFEVTAAGDMWEKHAQGESPEQYVGKQLTVQHFGFSKDGAPLLPVALRWREDL